MLKQILCVALLAISASAQGVIDYVQGVKNKPALDPRSYVFTRTLNKGATGTLTSAGSVSVIMTPCPLGITAASATKAYLLIDPGTAAQEAPKIATLSAAGANCTIGMTTTKAHPGVWVITNNGNGLQEALIDGAAVGKSIDLGPRSYSIYAPIYVPALATIAGRGGWVSFLQAMTQGYPILDAPGDHNTFTDFGMTNAGNVHGTVGNSGIRLGTSAHTNNFTKLTRLFVDFLYIALESVNAEQLHVTDCTFWDPMYSSIILANPLGPDAVGAQIVNNNFYADVSTLAEAFIIVHSTSSILVSNNNFIGNVTGNIKNCILNDSTTSGGWMVVNGNKCESAKEEAFRFTGVWTQLSIVGNVLSNSGGIANWKGIHLNGTGIGQYRNVVNSNVIQCGGTGNNGIWLDGTYSRTTVIGNDISDCSFGVLAGGSPSTTLIGQNNITGVLSSAIYAGGAGVMIDGPMNFTYAGLLDGVSGILNAANGSRVYCSNCNTTCTGTGNGQHCKKLNGVWTN